MTPVQKRQARKMAFVAHGMGRLIVEKTLSLAINVAVDIAAGTVGILFLGPTPQQLLAQYDQEMDSLSKSKSYPERLKHENITEVDHEFNRSVEFLRNHFQHKLIMSYPPPNSDEDGLLPPLSTGTVSGPPLLIFLIAHSSIRVTPYDPSMHRVIEPTPHHQIQGAARSVFYNTCLNNF
jgi:hypothetical protein